MQNNQLPIKNHVKLEESSITSKGFSGSRQSLNLGFKSDVGWSDKFEQEFVEGGRNLTQPDRKAGCSRRGTG